MYKNSTQPQLLQKLFELLERHRVAFGQERVYWRVVGMVLGEIFNFGRHTVTQGLMALGITDGDWSGWYRLFSQGRYEERKVAKVFFRETLEHTRIEEPYVVGVDGVQIPRSSLRMPGTSWLKAPRTPVFKVGIHRAQRFVHGSWLTPLEAGYSRAIPLRFLPAFPPKAKPANLPPQREWEAGADYVKWVREELDEAGRERQLQLVLADGSYDTLNFWRSLPERTVLAVRTARNRRLYYLPEKHPGRGRPASYGPLAPHPCDWLHQGIPWQKREVPVRGKSILMKFQVLGPFVREGLPDVPMFLIVVKGMHRKVGKHKPHYKHRKPAFYLVSAVHRDGRWQLPLPIETILALAEMRTGSCSSRNEKWLWRGREAMLESPRDRRFCSMECLGLCPAPAVCLSFLGLIEGPAHSHSLVAGCKTLVLQYALATISFCLLEDRSISGVLDTDPRQLAQKESFLIALSNSIAASARI